MADNDVTDGAYWDRRADAWDHREGMLERFTADLGRAGIEALGPIEGQRVLDIGCGPGATTLDLAGRVGREGEAIGLDISEAMLDAGRRRAALAGVDNVRFVRHDLEDEPMPGFDAVYSRFGVMFFADPVTAFANIAASVRPGGRVAVVVWAPMGDNPWMAVTNLGAAGALGVPLTPPGPGEPGPFSLSDDERGPSLLAGAGLVDVSATAVVGHIQLPADTAAIEVASMLAIGPLGEAYAAADASTRDAAVAAVLETAEPFRTDGGWELPGCALVLSGDRPA